MTRPVWSLRISSRGQQTKGIRDYGITDHIHTPYNLPDIAGSRAEFLANTPSARFHFGVEVSCVSQWELDEVATGHYDDPVYGLREGGTPGCELAIGLTAEDIATYQIEYVVGGTHWPMYVPIEREAVIRDYHRQNMFLATHPLVNIVAHPWWWMKYWADSEGCFTAEPWFDDFGAIPTSMHDEFAAAAIEHNTAVEANISACLLNPHYPQRFVAPVPGLSGGAPVAGSHPQHRFRLPPGALRDRLRESRCDARGRGDRG